MKPAEAPKSGLEGLAGLTSTKPNIEKRPTGLAGLSSLLSMKPAKNSTQNEKEPAESQNKLKRVPKKADLTLSSRKREPEKPLEQLEKETKEQYSNDPEGTITHKRVVKDETMPSDI